MRLRRLVGTIGMSHCVDDLVSRANDCFNWMLHTRPLNHLQGEKAQHNDSAHQNWTYMNSIPMFIAPFAKTERAKSQINDLNLAIKSFFETTPYEIFSQFDPQANEQICRFQLTRN